MSTFSLGSFTCSWSPEKKTQCLAPRLSMPSFRANYGMVRLPKCSSKSTHDGYLPNSNYNLVIQIRTPQVLPSQSYRVPIPSNTAHHSHYALGCDRGAVPHMRKMRFVRDLSASEIRELSGSPKKSPRRRPTPPASPLAIKAHSAGFPLPQVKIEVEEILVVLLKLVVSSQSVSLAHFFFPPPAVRSECSNGL